GRDAHAGLAAQTDDSPGSARTGPVSAHREPLLRAPGRADSGPLEPETGFASDGTPGRRPTYPRPDLRHAPRRCQEAAFLRIAPGASRCRFHASLAYAVDTGLLPREQECAQRALARCSPTPLLEQDAPPAPFGGKIPARVRCRFGPRR